MCNAKYCTCVVYKVDTSITYLCSPTDKWIKLWNLMNGRARSTDPMRHDAASFNWIGRIMWSREFNWTDSLPPCSAKIQTWQTFPLPSLVFTKTSLLCVFFHFNAFVSLVHYTPLQTLAAWMSFIPVNVVVGEKRNTSRRPTVTSYSVWNRVSGF